MTHYELCRATADRYLKDSQVVLFEYQNWVTGELPDVLCFRTDTTVLYEIKMSRSDFLADQKKDCREKWKNRGGRFYRLAGSDLLRWEAIAPELVYVEKPHLGRYRYYVCPHGLISPDELPTGWGLLWYKNGRFYRKQESRKFIRNIHAEIRILTHAMRKYASGDDRNILINTYEMDKSLDPV